MKDRQFIEEKLKHAGSRRRWQQSWMGLWKGFFWGALLWLTTLVVFKLFPIPFATLAWAGIAWVSMAIIGLVWNLFKPINLEETAQWVDDQCGLKERFTAVLEFQEKEHWGSVILNDAKQFIERIQPKNLIKFHLPSLAKWSVLILAVSAGLGFVPEYRTEAYLEKQREEAIIKSTGEHLVKFIRQEIKKRPPALKPTESAMTEVEKLGTQLSKAKLTRNNALKDLVKVTEKLRKEHASLDRNPALKRMQKAARTPMGKAPSEGLSAMQKRMDALKQQLGEKMAQQAGMQEMQRKLDQLKQAASGLQTPEGGMNEALKQSMAQQLGEMAQKAAQMGMSAEQLDAALSNLKAGDFEKFLKNLNQAQIDMEKMAQVAKELQNLQMQMSQIGKDLAEQLEKGQATFARQNLLEKADKLMSGKLSKEDFEKMLKELQQAIPEAGEYGKVQDLLKQAAQQMQEGDQSGAAESMRAAADELKNLMDQLGDMQSLMASLDKLMTAKMCVGNCMGWGQCSKPGFKPGGKPGSGVGTWGDEGGAWQYNTPQQAFDNSGIERPDMAGKGHTDRGEGELVDGLTPTKVKGQFNPGAPMPSITLKGLSIKGQSRVEFTESVTAAQADAESALSQQRVPRAYQNAVRDYFDDLKQ
jgi:hypothetical protein